MAFEKRATRELMPCDDRTSSWTVRMWPGESLPTWIKLLVRNRFAVDWPYLWLIPPITLMGIWSSSLNVAQRICYGRRIARTTIEHDPIFIIGHWRSGTTLLHELLTLDPRHTFPTTYQCVTADHFLVSDCWLLQKIRPRLPSRRLTDNMAMGWDRPQEDEIALAVMGAESPYLTFAFPNRSPQHAESFALEDIPAKARNRWKRTFLRFLKQLTLSDPRRVVLKSPTHTFRIKVLLEMFPDARFVHIVRDPYTTFTSTLHLWKTIYRAYSLQRPRFEHLEEYVLDTFVRMHARLDETKPLVVPNRFVEVRYEELVSDTSAQLRRVYGQLELDRFDDVRPKVEDYLVRVAGYRTNRHELSPRSEDLVTRRWGSIIQKYGYPMRGRHGLTNRENRG